MPFNTQYFELSDSSFEKNQQNEINEGINDGLSVDIYAKSCYDALQMREIRLGLLAGIDVSVYAKPEYDFFQMQEIRFGLESKLDVSKYAFASIPFEKMKQLRLSLAAGINLFKYRNYEAGIIRQIRLAAIDNVDIRPFLEEGYDAGQLEPIRLALLKNIDIRPYISTEFRGVALNEIYLGLEKCLDVSKYCSTEYDWRQMREIRKGLELRVDVDEYRNPLYDWGQMQEIRLGLLEGLDVSYYKSFVYTASDMKNRRKRLSEMEVVSPEKVLEDNAHLDGESPEVLELISKILGEPVTETVKDNSGDKISISVSEDEMQAYIIYSGTGEELTKDYLYSALRSRGIIFGVVSSTVDMLVNGRGFGESHIIANGKNPGQGRDGWYEFFFDTKEKNSMILPDGSVNYREYDWFVYVKQNQKLVEYHPAEFGNYGYSVTGKMLKGSKGTEQVALSGKGFYLSENKNEYFSSEDGKVTYEKEVLEVTGVLEVDEVTQATGAVDFAGSVHVKGAVGTGASIKAAGDVVVDGFVEGAVISAGGNVLLRCGSNGNNIGKITAKGNISGQFFERITLEAGGDINADYCLNCDISSDSFLRVKGSHGNIVGGVVRATLGIMAKNIGNWANVPSLLIVGVDERIRKRINMLDLEKNSSESEIRILNNAQNDFKKKYPPEIRNSMEMYIKIENAIFTKQLDLERINNERAELDDLIEKTKNVAVDILGTIYENIEVQINNISWQSRKLSGVRLKNVNGIIVSR